METIRIFVMLIIPFLVISCHRHDITKEFYENGKIKKQTIQLKSENLKEVIEFFENGDTLSVQFFNQQNQKDSICRYFNDKNEVLSFTYKNGERTGTAKRYYSDGGIKEKFYLYKGKRTGKHLYFRKDGSLEQISFYILLKDSSYCNGMLKFNTKEKVLSDSSDYVEIVSKDTIQKGELFEYKFRMFLKTNVLARAFIGDFDENFYLLDSTTLAHLDIDASNYIKPTKVGENVLRIIFETKEDVKRNRKDNVLVGEKYLEKKFFVKD